jgi:hypothetical protein
MKIITLTLSLVFASASLLLDTGTATAAAVVKTQAPCPGQCIFFGSTGAIPPAKSIIFAAPSKGTAIVTFHGSIYCTSTNIQTTYIALDTQIVEGSNPVDANGPGALHHEPTLQPIDSTPAQTSSFNLGSTRVFNIAAAGTHTYRFKLTRRFPMSANTGCSVENGMFIVNFVP